MVAFASREHLSRQPINFQKKMKKNGRLNCGRVDAGKVDGGHRFSASLAPRFRAVSTNEVRPGPGAYDTTAAPQADTLPSAAFRSGVSRTEPRNAGAKQSPIEDTLGVPRSHPGGPSSAGAPKSGAAANATPGPGYYAPVSVQEVYARNLGNGPSPVFREGITGGHHIPLSRLQGGHHGSLWSSTERLSRQPINLPGPGAYDTQTAPDRQGKRTFAAPEEGAPISSAVFMSSTRRGAEPGTEGPRAPGPAYYNPSTHAVHDKRSFHFNQFSKWTPS
eukprot:CAMPEP_0179958400 /NCGR_PEP_ID=MMETSP0983-20121128/28005_1 /TAXON_ID=483367 /ORGANISM="non described non described, Strain CCMP 2436" /LENGTH=275 /DNA_ID=CAMNT_0021870517 /DNA_START=65 /DNA_END=893 /DNA_ORIENTATION=+